MKKILISILTLFSLSAFSIAEENSQPEIIIKSSFEDINNLFDWAEDSYPELFSPSRTETFEILGYTARYYQRTSNYVGTKNERAYAYGDVFGGLFDAGAINNYLKRAYKPFQHVAIQVNNYQLNASSYPGTIGGVPVEFEVINNSLSALVPALSSGEYNLSVLLDEKNVSTAITILDSAPIENPRAYIQDTVDGLGTDLEGILVNLEPLNDSDLIAVINETLINLKAINLDALSTEELELLSQIIEVNKLNGSTAVDRLYRTAKTLPGCDLPKLKVSLKTVFAEVTLATYIILAAKASFAISGGISAAVGVIGVGILALDIDSQSDVISEIIGDCLEPETWLEDLLDELRDSRLKRIAKSNSSFLNFQSEVEKTVYIKSEYQYPETVQNSVQELKNLLNKIIDFLPSSFDTLVSNLNKDGKIEYRNGANFSVTNISSSLVTLDSENHNGKSLKLTFKLAEGENKEQNFTFDLSDNAYDVDPLRISAKIIAKECTPGDTWAESCPIENGLGFETRSCSADGSAWGDYSSCELSHCNTGYIQEGNSCVPEPTVCTSGDTQAESCPITNGRGFETRSCSADGSAWGDYSSCELSHCNTGYVQEGNSCVPNPNPTFCNSRLPDLRLCTISNGQAFEYRDCGADGQWGSWGECTIEKCDIGYKKEGQICVKLEPKGCTTGPTGETCSNIRGNANMVRYCETTELRPGVIYTSDRLEWISCNEGFVLSNKICQGPRTGVDLYSCKDVNEFIHK